MQNTLAILEDLRRAFKKHGDHDLNDIPVTTTIQNLDTAIAEVKKNSGKKRVLVEVRGGTVVYVASNSKDAEVVIVDHDGEETTKMDTPVDKVMSDKKLDKYIEKIMEEPGNQ